MFSAIKNALKQENLNPEIEEKLLQLQRYQEKQMKQDSGVPQPVVAPSTPIPTTPPPKPQPARKRPQTSSEGGSDVESSKKKVPKLETKEIK